MNVIWKTYFISAMDKIKHEIKRKKKITDCVCCLQGNFYVKILLM